MLLGRDPNENSMESLATSAAFKYSLCGIIKISQNVV